MATECTSCGRSTTVEGATFCMFCGGRLSQHDPSMTVDHVESSESTQDTVPDAVPPQRIGGYRIVRRLGEGGMGSVFEAEADETGQRVAVKLLSSKLSTNPISVERFRQEGRLASQIVHPRCVFVYSADADAGRPFIVMELMPGKTLKDIVEAKGPLLPGDAVARILDVVDGLIEAHRLGLIHRDVKPSNCFVTADNRVKVGDFGLSKSLLESESDGQLTGTGAFLGTVLYAPPEQIRGEEVGYDSDVYSICATLYYLLTARAPYQHESMTAALAKAISEPPPPIRRLRPDVPKALERVVLKGLERDRTRRYGSLEELRDAIQQLLPEEQVPARTRMLVAAYLLDTLLTVFVVQLPVEFMEWLVGLRRSFLGGYQMFFDPISTGGYILYFAVCEGFFGATVGKWLLGLQVVPRASVGPPGFGLATLRAAAFHVGWLIIYLGFVCMAEIPLVGVPLGLFLILGGIAYLAYRIRRPKSNRGLHDLASGCQVVQLPRPPHRVRLTSQAPNRLDRATAIPGLPTTLGGYSVRGRLVEYRDGSQVWIADDRSLGRRVLIHLQKPSETDASPPTRPNRLRLLGNGELDWQTRQWLWNAFAAPAGAPLADMVRAENPLNWPDSRLLLEQIVEELQSAENDGTLTPELTLNQLWSEPGGRIYLLDFPIPSAVKAKPVDEPILLVRQAASLMLEGAPRDNAGRVTAPLPPRASAITNRLFQNEPGYTQLSALQTDLAESHAHEPTVTTKMRATQIGVASVLVAFPLLLLLVVTQFVSFIATAQTLNMRAVTSSLLNRIDRPSMLSAWREQPVLAESLSAANLERTRGRLRALHDSQDAEFEHELHSLSRPERYVVVRYRDFLKASEASVITPTHQDAAALIQLAEAGEYRDRSIDWREAILALAVRVCLFVILMFAFFALLFRGGLAYPLAGIALVRRDGRRAGRLRCAAREILLWLPLVLVLIVSTWIQVEWPGWFTGRVIATGCTMALLVGYVALGFRSPEQGPHDRFLGTWRVPA